MKRSSLTNPTVNLLLFLMLSVPVSFGAPPAKPPVAGSKVNPAKGSRAPDAQAVNNSGVKIHQVKIGNVIFQDNLSSCTDGCSTGFKTVGIGHNQIYIKAASTDPWVNLGSLGKFEADTHYAVNLKKKGKNLCAELFTRKNTDAVFNNDPTKNKIHETCRTFSAAPVSQKPTTAANTTAQANANVPARSQGGAAATSPASGQMQMRLPKPEIENVHFERALPGQQNMMSTSANIPGAGAVASQSVPTIRGEFGEVLSFNCGFTTKNVESLIVRIVYPNGSHGNLSYGTPRDLPDGKKRYWFQTGHMVKEDELLIFRVIGTGIHGTAQAEKQIRIDARSPILELRQPEFNDDTREVTFRIKNTGDMAFPGSGDITLQYEVKGKPGNESITRSRLSGANLTIDRNHIVPVGTITLPETVLNYDQIEMVVTMSAKCNQDYLPDKIYTFPHTWDTHTFTIDEPLLSVFSSLFRGEVRINTFEDGHGDRSDTQPYVGNDSYINLTVSNPGGGSRPVLNQPIPIQWFRFGSDGVEAYVYIDELEARIDGAGLFFIRDGKLGLRIAFNCSASKEIEVWARDAIAKCWRDNWLPDLDLRNFSIELLLTPILDGQKISYSDLTMNANVDLEMPGHYIERYLEGEAASRIESSFRSVFDNADVKSAVENNLNQLVGGNPLLTIRRLLGVRGSGNTIVITYR